MKRTAFFKLFPAFLLTGLLCGNSAIAQLPELSFQRIGVDQGLSQGSVFDMLQDSLGFMWFGTADGLNRYDGYTFRVYRKPMEKATSANANFIRNILQGSDSYTLWISTTGPHELYRFNVLNGTFQLVFAGKGKHMWGDILPLKQEGELIWLIDQDDGINCLNWKTEKNVYHLPLKTPMCRSNAVIKTAHGITFLEGNDILSFDLVTRRLDTIFNAARYGKQFDFHVLCSDNKNNLWIGGNSLLCVNPATKQYQEFKSTFAKDGGSVSIISIMTIDDRYLCAGTERNGIYIFDKMSGSFRAYTNDKNDPASLPSNRVSRLYTDRSHNFWVGNDPYGICKGDLKKKKFHSDFASPSQPNDLSSNFIKCFLQGGDKLYIGTYDKGLNVWDRSSNTYVHLLQEEAKGTTPQVIYALDKDKAGNVWIATERGLRILDKKTNKVTVPELPPALTDVCFSVKVLNDTCVLAGWREGLYLIHKKEATYTAELLMAPAEEEIRGFVQDKNKILAFSFEDIFELKTLADQRISVKGVFEYNAARIKCLFQDNKGTLWMGTENGLLKISPDFKLQKSYHDADGLPNSFIYGIEQDSKGFLWLSTNKGLSKFDPGKETFKNYDVSDGLQANEFNTGAYYRAADGELFFGGVNGFNYFYPDSIAENHYVPVVALTDFKVFDKTYTLDTAIEYKRSIQLNYTENSISFEYAGLEFTHSEKNQYAYRLAGVDKDWVMAGKNRYARYADLNPGDYTFEVKAANNDGVWSDQITSVQISIRPPFWKTWYFIVFMFVLMGIVIFSSIRYFTARQYKRQLREVQVEQASRLKAILETEEKERKRIAQELHDGLGQMLSTARMTVSGLEDAEKEEDQQRVKKSLKIIDAACEEVRHISHNMMPGALIQVGLIPALEDLVETINASGMLEMRFETNITEPIGESLEIGIYRIVQEICNNIIKHAKAKNIRLSILRDKAAMRVEIKDDGIGFSTDKIKKSMGIGWKNIFSRVSSLNGTIRINSEAGKGTTISIELRNT